MITVHISESEIESKSKGVDQGKVHVIPERCKECGICIEFCPNDVLKKSEEINTQGYHYPEPKSDKHCIACRKCERLCPDFAIWIEEKDD